MNKTDIEALVRSLQKVHHQGTAPVVLTDCQDDGDAYDEACLVFNRRFHRKPLAIVKVKSTEQVKNAVEVAIEGEYLLRARSGGHDHEGESIANGAILIDFSEMKDISFNEDKTIAYLQPGLRFMDIIGELDENKISIPHGTCQTVSPTGFTMGGGWGPWTRRHGMCCEHLIGATIVLGDGTIKELSEDGNEEARSLLWALRGGGGFSYGIVTQLRIATFQQPEHTIKFNCVWRNTPAIKVLKRWEELIAPKNNYQLLGTNLKIMAIPTDEKDIEDSVHECTFYGYYDGSNKELKADLRKWFADLMPDETNMPKIGEKLDNSVFSSWDRVSKHNQDLLMDGNPPTLIPPDTDDPAPHRISSRLVQATPAGQSPGLGTEGRKNLIASLRSDLIDPEAEKLHLHTYVTLGAISGPYYDQYKEEDHKLGSAFPYKDRPYTIQYQVWWNAEEGDIALGKQGHIYQYVNRALDWISEAQRKDFPQTKGSFISFKDASIPTAEYFQESYERLKEIKLKYSRDENNILRSRKTII